MQKKAIIIWRRRGRRPSKTATSGALPGNRLRGTARRWGRKLRAAAGLAVFVGGLVSVRADAADPLQSGGFAGIPWLATHKEAGRVLVGRHKARYVREESRETEMIFKGGEFAGRPAGEWKLGFEKGRMRRAEVLVPLRDRAEFEGVKAFLVERHGDPASEVGHEDGGFRCEWNGADSGSPGERTILCCFEPRAAGTDGNAAWISYEFRPAIFGVAEAGGKGAADSPFPIGCWEWPDGTILELRTDGTAERTAQGKWECEEALVIRWDDGSDVRLEMSRDGGSLCEVGSDGSRIVAKRKLAGSGESAENYFGTPAP